MKEIKDRDKTIGDKETKIYELKKQNQELENKLNFQVRTLQNYKEMFEEEKQYTIKKEKKHEQQAREYELDNEQLQEQLQQAQEDFKLL